MFRTAIGRVEVYAAIPPADGRSPDGPHTHLLPHLPREGRTHPPTVPIPAGLCPTAHLYPAHPLRDLAGRPRAFDRARHLAFQRILADFGDAGQARLKATTMALVRAGEPPERAPAAERPDRRAAMAVALRQLAQLDGEGPALAAWRDRRRPPAELLDPEGDPNG